MATETILIPAAGATNVNRLRRLWQRFALLDYWALTKPEVNFLIGIATLTGFALAYQGTLPDFPFSKLAQTLLGTLLVASGTATLNQWMERSFDLQMRRTARRPVATGRISASTAFVFGCLLSLAGIGYLVRYVNSLASLLALITLLLYLLLYTPSKRKTPLCVLIGALPGAMPPLIGWAALSGTLGARAWLLFAMVFLWQFPHVMAIAWMYREDYDRAGFKVLPRPWGEKVQFLIWQTTLPTLALIALTLVAMVSGHYSSLSLVGVVLMSVSFLHKTRQLAIRLDRTSARQLLYASIIYLPLLFGLMMLGRMRGV